MAGSRKQGPIRFDGDLEIGAATRRGPLGRHRWADTRAADHLGDTPGPVGVNDAAAVLAGGLPATPAAARRPSARQTSQTLTPVAYANRYHNTRVSYLDPQSGLARSVTVDVHIYNNYGIPGRRANMSEKATLVGRLRRELRRAGGLRLIGVESNHKVQIARSFYGKGSPEDYAMALTYALRYRRATPGNLQSYCDQTAQLGLDCSGFVNAYFMEIGRIGEPKQISSYERGTLRERPEDIRALDVLIWQGTSIDHIAVVDHVIANSDPKKMIVVESSGSKGGLVESEYTILEVRNKIFEVDRGRPAGGVSRVKFAGV